MHDVWSMLDSGAVPLYLAPQAGVSELPFRRLCRRFGADVGCPLKKVVQRQGDSACLRGLDLLARIIRAVDRALHEAQRLLATCLARYEAAAA